ncbi:hypothetical protein EVAR_14500_1 [Eumeta japonica]|uniref:Uncharacterized protein n=1 Tax=Eumeta variegata TaxID=151549 RepID=A0A4C1U3Y6_EUMVA|nr:hypothetical protein EVAR_14500_1 [Eumeta japonica]
MGFMDNLKSNYVVVVVVPHLEGHAKPSVPSVTTVVKSSQLAEWRRRRKQVALAPPAPKGQRFDAFLSYIALVLSAYRIQLKANVRDGRVCTGRPRESCVMNDPNRRASMKRLKDFSEARKVAQCLETCAVYLLF